MKSDNSSAKLDRTDILSVPISCINLHSAVRTISDWAMQSRVRMVFVRDVASLMAAVDEPRLLELHHRADLVVADGMPLVWISRLRGIGAELGRVAGADLVDELCRHSLNTGLKHYLYGGKPGVAAEMKSRLQARFPSLRICGVYSPPMREIGPDFEPDQEVLSEINSIRESGADIIWVGISSPKQEYLMTKFAPLLNKGILIGVGAAFDFHSGRVRRAPAWCRDNGFEWLHRLASEPRRLWRRYLVLAPRFLFAVIRNWH